MIGLHFMANDGGNPSFRRLKGLIAPLPQWV
jgi:hypothetical protein